MGWGRMSTMLLVLLACTGPEGSTDLPATEPEGPTSPIEGERVWTPILGAEESLDDPRDLGFDGEGYLWIANRKDDQTFIVFDAGTPEQSYQRRQDAQASHFMEETMAFSFDGNAQFGSCGESRNTYNDQARANDFMGPVLWLTDLTVFGEMNPYQLGAHIDMLHESPNCMGIAWETENVYWVFDGKNDDIVRYDFQEDHGIGQDDHSDGIVYRMAEPTVTRVPDAPSHLVYDPERHLLYVADTGGGRILWLDTTSGSRGEELPQRLEPLDDYAMWEGVAWGEIVTGLADPSGLAMLPNGNLVVGEWGSGLLREFTQEGEEVHTLDTGLGAGVLQGIELGPDGLLWVAETGTPGVWHLEPAD